MVLLFILQLAPLIFIIQKKIKMSQIHHSMIIVVFAFCSFFSNHLTSRETETTIQLSERSFHLSLPKSFFPHSSILYCLQGDCGFFLLSTDVVSLTISFYSHDLLTQLLQVSGECLSVHPLSSFPFTYQIQMEKESIFLQRQSILSRMIRLWLFFVGIQGNPVFFDDFMNSGFPQYCAISSDSTYSLFSSSQELLQVQSFHSHSMKSTHSTPSQRQVFFKGLEMKRLSLEKELTLLKKDHSIIHQLSKGEPIDQLTSFTKREETHDKGILKQGISGNPHFEVIWVNSSWRILVVKSKQSLRFVVIIKKKDCNFCCYQQKDVMYYWIHSEWMKLPVYLCCYQDDKLLSVREINLQKSEENHVYSDYPRLVFLSHLHRPIDGYVSSTISYQTLFNSIVNSIEQLQDEDSSAHLDLIYLKSTYYYIMRTRNELLEELTHLKEEMNVVLV